jgi:alkaline phosphatase D
MEGMTSGRMIPGPALGRRAFLGASLTAAAGALAGCVPPRGLASRGFSFGPAATDVTVSSALVWLRPRGPARVQVEYGLQPDLADAALSAPAEATAEGDFTVAVELSGLEAGREYFYRGTLATAAGAVERGAVGRFRTPPADGREFRLGWSGDMDAVHQPYSLLGRVAEEAPDLFLFVGDTIYADHPRDQAATTLAGYRAKHRENRDDPFLQRLLARTAVAAIWDDHEVANDFDGTHAAVADGRTALREYWPMRTAEPSVLYRRLAWGPGADILILDTRQYRSPRAMPDGPGKSMLGRRQKEWLKAELAASRAPFKFVVSSIPFLGAFGPDKWNGFATERDELKRFFRQERIGGLVFLSADMHLAMDLADGDGLRDFVAGPIGAWPFCRVLPRRGALRNTERFSLCDAYTYGLIAVRPEASPPAIEVQIRDGANAVRYATRITAPGAS